MLKVLAGLALFMSVFGCVFSGEAPAQPGGEIPEGRVAKIAYLPITHALPVLAEKEFFALQAGPLELVKYGSWTELMDALNAGRVDGATVLLELAIKAKEQGIPLKAVALGHKDGNVVIVSPEINTPADLKGKTIAVPHRHSSHNLLVRQMLRNADMTEKDIRIVELAPAEMPAALARKQISAYCVAEPFGAKSVVMGTGKMLFQSGELWKDSICCALVFTEAFLKEHPDLAKTIISQYIAAGRLIENNPGHARSTAMKYMNVDDAVLDLSLEWISYDNLAITREAYEDLTARLADLGLPLKPPAYEVLVDASFFEEESR